VVLLSLLSAFRLCEMRAQNAATAAAGMTKGDEGKRKQRGRPSPGQPLQQRLWSHMRTGKLHLLLLAYALNKLQDKDVDFGEVVDYCEESMLWYRQLFIRRDRAAAEMAYGMDGINAADEAVSSHSARDMHPLAFLHVPDALFILQQWVVQDSHVRWELETHICQCFPGSLLSMAVLPTSGVSTASSWSPTGSTEDSVVSVVDMLGTLRALPSAFSSPQAQEGDNRMSQLISALKFGIPGAHDTAGEVATLARTSLLLDNSTIAPINATPVKRTVTPSLSPAQSISKKGTVSGAGASAAAAAAVGMGGSSFLPPIAPPPGPSSTGVLVTPDLLKDSSGENEDEGDIAGEDSGSPAEESGDFTNYYGDEEQLLFSGSSVSRGLGIQQSAPWLASSMSSSVMPRCPSPSPHADSGHLGTPQTLAALEASQSFKKLHSSPGVPSPVPAPPPTPPQGARPARRRSRHNLASPGTAGFPPYGIPTSPSDSFSVLPSPLGSESFASPSNQTSGDEDGHGGVSGSGISSAILMPRLVAPAVAPILTPSPPKGHMSSAPALASASPRQPRVVGGSISSQQTDGEEQRHFVRKRHAALSSPSS
jgi:hypothetical protein